MCRGCDFIHKDLNETKTDEVICSNPASPDDENCLCGLGPGHETVQCPECRKRLCKKCPMYPVGNHPECLECIFSMFSEISTSTPIRPIRLGVQFTY